MSPIDIRQLVRTVLEAGEAQGSARPAPPDVQPASSQTSSVPRDQIALSAEAYRQLADEVFEALASILRPATETSQTPEHSADSAVFRALLANPETHDEFVRLLSQPGVADRLLERLSNPDLAPVALRLLALPQMSDLADEIAARMQSLEIGEATEQVLEWVRRPDTRADALRLLLRPGLEDLAKEVLTRDDMREILPNLVRSSALMNRMAGFFAEPEVAERLLLALEESGAKDTTRQFLAIPEVTRQISRYLANPALSEISPETRQILIRLLESSADAQTLRRVFDQPQVRGAAADLIASPETGGATLRILARPEMTETARGVLSSPGAVKALTQVFAAPGQPAESGETSRLLIRILVQPEMASVTRTVLAQADVQERLPDLLQTDARLLLLEILARPEMASVAELAINRPEMREIATGVLVNGSTAPTEGLSRSAVEAPLLLRILATSGTGETARQMLQAVGPEPLSRLIQDSRNQAFLFDLIVKAESPEIALELLSSGPAREALRRVGTLAGSEGRLTALLESPATAPALLDVLSETLSSQDLARLFTDKAFQSRLPALLGDPDSARALLQIAGKPEMQGMARFILARRDTPDRLAQWLASEQTFEASLQVLQNATPDLRVRLAAALHDAAMQPETLRALEALFTQEADPEVRSAALKLLSWPELTEAAARVLESPEARETLVRMLTQAADAIRRLAPEIPASETGKLPDLENLLRLLSRPEMASTLRRVFAFQEIRTALGDLLAPPESIPAEDRSVRDAASILRLLSRSELTNAATEILSRADVRSRIPFFLLQPDVRGAMLEVLSAPGLEHVARAALATPEAQSTLLIALQDPKTQAHLPRLLDSSLAEPILRLVADNGGRLDISGALQKPEVQQRLFALLKNPALRSITLEILTRPDLVRNTATFVGDHPETLLSLLNSPETCRLLATLFQKPQMTKALERFLRVARRSDQLPDSARSFLRELEGLPHGAASQGREGTATGIGAGIRRLFGFGSTHAPVPSSAVLPDTTASPVPSRVTPSNSTRTVAQATPPSPESAITGSIREVLHEASTARTTGDAPLPLRTEAIHYAFNYHLAVLFPWFGFGGPVSAASVSAAVHAEDGAYIPTFLDLIQDEPLMLPWEPGELMIPGTDIPLILPREDRP